MARRLIILAACLAAGMDVNDTAAAPLNNAQEL